MCERPEKTSLDEIEITEAMIAAATRVLLNQSGLDELMTEGWASEIAIQMLQCALAAVRACAPAV